MMGRFHWTPLQLQALLLVACTLARAGSGAPTSPTSPGANDTGTGNDTVTVTVTVTSFEAFSDMDTGAPTAISAASASMDAQTMTSGLIQDNNTSTSNQPPMTEKTQTTHASTGTSTQQSTATSFMPSTHTTHLLTTHSMSRSATQSKTQSTAQSTTQSTSRSATQSKTQSTAQSTTQSSAAPKSTRKHTTQTVPSSNHSDGDWNIIGIRKNSFTGKILLPIAIGILFSVVIIAVAYIYCSRKRPRSVSKQNGNGVHSMTSMDRVMLLADSSEDEF